ncbi:MAG: M24 family metallopeptidase [Solirubrobacteraceae bacterium]
MTPLDEHRAFPAEEHDARVAAVRETMRERDLEALLLAAPEDVYYLVGLNHLGYFAVTLLVLPLEGPPLLAARAMERPTVRLQAPGCVHLAYEDGDDPADAAIAAVRGANAGRVGVDRSTTYLPPGVWERIHTGAAGVQWTDASGLVARARMVKSPAEIAHVRAAAAISDRALQAGLAAAGEAVSEREVAAAIYAELIGAGSEYPAFPPLVRSTPTLELEHVTWSDRALARGDALFVELSASVARYHAPLTRIAHVGEAPAGLEDVAAHALAGLDAVRGALRPGAWAGEVYDAWQAAVDSALGHSGYRRHHCGYIVGIGFPPTWAGAGTPVGLRPGQELVLREGMVFHVFSWIFGQGPADYGVSDTALVTADGCELLTTTAREPIITDRR